MDSGSESAPQQTKTLVIGGTGRVGGYIVEHLVRRGQCPVVLSRSPQQQGGPDVDWIRGDLEKLGTFDCPTLEVIYCTADAVLLAKALPCFFHPSLRRIVAFSSTSVMTKLESEVAAERDMIRRLS